MSTFYILSPGSAPLTENDSRDDGGDIGVDDCRHRPAVSGINRRQHTPPQPQLFTDAFINQHIGVNRHADGQHDTGDTRQSEGSPQQVKTGKQHRHIHQ